MATAAYRHYKPILAVGVSDHLFTAPDAFVAAIANHRHSARETDPPRM